VGFSPSRCKISLLCCLLAFCAISSAEAQVQITQIIDWTGDGAGNGMGSPGYIAVDSSGNGTSRSLRPPCVGHHPLDLKRDTASTDRRRTTTASELP
jgi:hypothetical protein